MGSAISYTFHEEEYLRNFFKDGRYELSNNLAKQRIKPFVIARKNFLFSNTKKGAKASTIYFSLIEFAKINKLNPYKYLEYVLDILSTKGLSNEIKNSVLPYSKQLPKNLYVKKRIDSIDNDIVSFQSESFNLSNKFCVLILDLQNQQ